MKINESTGVNPEYWGEKTQKEFLDKFKGKASKEKLIEVYKACRKSARK